MNDDTEILLVEDSPTQAERLRYLMEGEGYRTRVANNGKQALEALRERKPNLVLTDVVMPEMDGYTLCRTIKADARLSDVPVILVTSLADPNDILNSLECGADNLIRKPYVDDYLLKRIEYVLMNQRLRMTPGDALARGTPLYVGGQEHFVKASRQQVLDLLISTYEQAVSVNDELQARERQVRELNDRLARRAAELEVINEEVLRSNRELESFSYSVSHDLRAPLRAIDGYSGLLQTGHADGLSAEGLRYLGFVRESAQRMGHLIEDLLRFAKTAREPLNRRPVPLAVLVRECLAEFRGEIESRHIEVRVGALPQCAVDVPLVRQVFANLLGNAVKYTRYQPQPVIEIACDSSSGEQVIYVKDNGAGFDMKLIDKLFGVFQRLHGHEFEGTGVGLAIVQRIVQRHGGRIWAEAEPGCGATFYLTLEAAPGEAIGRGY